MKETRIKKSLYPLIEFFWQDPTNIHAIRCIKFLYIFVSKSPTGDHKDHFL